MRDVIDGLLDAYSLPIAALAIGMSLISDAGAGLGLSILAALWLWPRDVL